MDDYEKGKELKRSQTLPISPPSNEEKTEQNK